MELAWWELCNWHCACICWMIQKDKNNPINTIFLCLYKTNYGIENYLNYISKPKFRIALSKLRASSHDLEIERGRYVRPKLNLNDRLCMSCHVIEDEEHFVTGCINNLDMRESLFNKIATKEPSFANLSNQEKFIYLMSCNDRQILTWFGKFLHNSFQTRNLRTILRS